MECNHSGTACICTILSPKDNIQLGIFNRLDALTAEVEALKEWKGEVMPFMKFLWEYSELKLSFLTLPPPKLERLQQFLSEQK